MKVILTKDVKGMGRAHETVTVADGYALNYLIPAKLAVAATQGATAIATMRAQQAISRKELDQKLIAQNIASLADAKLVLTMKANDKGHLYDAVDATELSKAAKEQARIDLPEEVIKLEKPIKEVGTFEIPVSAGEVFGTFSVTVQAE
jgi:large subunit ribosomal protein L9